MDQHRIRCVLAVYASGSFTRAANALFSSPQHMKDEVDAAERELGCALFMRSRKGCAPTDAGEAFAKDGKEVLDRIDSFCNTVKQEGFGRKEVRVQSFEGKEIPVLDDICYRFKMKYPHVSIKYVNSTAFRMYDDLVNGICDVAFFQEGIPHDHADQLCSRMCKGLVMKYQCMVAYDDELARRDVITSADLRGRNVAICALEIPREFAERGIQINTLLPWERYAVFNHCADGGICIGDEYFSARSPQIAIVPLKDVSVQIRCMFKSNPPEHLRRFLEMTDVG